LILGDFGLGSPTARTALEYVAMMQQAIEHGGDGNGITSSTSH
jgi:hypothetical protein